MTQSFRYMYFKEDVNCFANLYQTKIKPNQNSLWYTCTVILVAPYDIKPKTYVKRQGTLLLKVLTKVLPSLAKQVKLGAVLQFTEIRQEADERFHILFFKSILVPFPSLKAPTHFIVFVI